MSKLYYGDKQLSGSPIVDTTPTSGSTHVISSGAVYTGLAGKAPTDHSHNDKQNKITASGVLKGNGNGSVSAAIAGTDFPSMASLLSIANYHVWEKSHIEPFTNIGSFTDVSIAAPNGVWNTVYLTYYDEPTCTTSHNLNFTANTYATSCAVLKGKYMIVNSVLYYCDPNGSASDHGSNSAYIYYPLATYDFGTEKIVDTYLMSPDSTAYPHGATQENYFYSYLGCLGSGSRILFGEYIGTGVSGNATNCNQLLFSSPPKLLWVYAYQTSSNRSSPYYYTPFYASNSGKNIIFCSALSEDWLSGSGFNTNTNGDIAAKRSSDGKTIYWYNTFTAATNQFNELNNRYYYAYLI